MCLPVKRQERVPLSSPSSSSSQRLVQTMRPFATIKKGWQVEGNDGNDALCQMPGSSLAPVLVTKQEANTRKYCEIRYAGRLNLKISSYWKTHCIIAPSILRSSLGSSFTDSGTNVVLHQSSTAQVGVKVEKLLNCSTTTLVLCFSRCQGNASTAKHVGKPSFENGRTT